MGEFVRVEVADQIATIRLDRPKMNALNAQFQAEIAAAAVQVSKDSAVRAVILYGGERVFAAGADIKELAPLGPRRCPSGQPRSRPRSTTWRPFPSRSWLRSRATRSAAG